MRLRIVEFADELHNHKYLEEEKIVALNPCAQSFLKKRKIKFENSTNFFGSEGHKSVLRKSKNMMNAIKNFYNFTDKNNLSVSYTEGFNNLLTFYLRYLLISLYIIDKVIKKYNPQEIVIPESTLIKDSHYHWFKKERLLGHLVKKYVKHNDLRIKLIEEKKDKNFFKFNFIFFQENIMKIISFFSYYAFKYFFRKKDFYLILSDNNNLSNVVSKIKIEKPKFKPVFLSLSNDGIKRYGFDILKGLAFNLFFNFSSYDVLVPKPQTEEIKNIKKSIDNFTKNLTKDNDLSKIFYYLNVNLIDELNTFASNALLKSMQDLNAKINHLVKVIKISKPKFMISQHSFLIGCAMGELSKIHNIPAIAISHSTHTSHKSEDIFYECRILADTMMNKIFPYIAVQNPQMLQFLQDNNYQSEQMINTGPLLYNKNLHKEKNVKNLKKNIFGEYSNKKIILHAGTPKIRGSSRLIIYETVDEYIKNINNIISVIREKKDIFLAIRYRDSPHIPLKDFKELVKESENCKIYHEGNFKDFLAVSDIMISYSSTTIDEALYNKVPVILYDSDNKYCHIQSSKINQDVEKLIDGVFYCSELNELNFTIDKIF